MKKLIFLSLIMASSLLLVQCGESENESQDNIEQEKQEVLSDLEDLQGDLDERIDELSTRIENAGDEAGDDWEAALEELKGDRSELDRTIDSVEDASRENWDSVKSGAEELFDNISSTLDEWESELEDLFDD